MAGKKLTKNEQVKLITKVILAHFITYMACGMLFMTLLNYENYIELIGFKSMDELNPLMIMLGQIVRGILLGFVVWWIKDSIIGKKHGWFKLWAILVIVGIISTYGPAPGSIEGFIYLDNSHLEDVPLRMNLSILEVLVQPLLFSIIVTYQRKKGEINGKEIKHG
jgi:hypothetical protein